MTINEVDIDDAFRTKIMRERDPAHADKNRAQVIKTAILEDGRCFSHTNLSAYKFDSQFLLFKQSSVLTHPIAQPISVALKRRRRAKKKGKLVW